MLTYRSPTAPSAAPTHTNTVLVVRGGQVGASTAAAVSALAYHSLPLRAADVQPGEHSAPLWEADPTTLVDIISGYDVVVLATDRPYPAFVSHLNRLSYDCTTAFMAATWYGPQVIVGPLVVSRTPGCYECWRRRREAAVGDGVALAEYHRFLDAQLDYSPQGTLPIFTSFAVAAITAQIARIVAAPDKQAMSRRWWSYHTVQQAATTHSLVPLAWCSVCDPTLDARSTTVGDLQNELHRLLPQRIAPYSPEG